MKSIAKSIGALVASLALVLAFGAVSAQASNHVLWDPPGEEFDGLSTDSELIYGGNTLSCDQAGADGETPDPAAAEGPLDDVWFGPNGNNCDVDAFGADINDIVVQNPENWTLEALNEDGNGSGDVQIHIPSDGAVWVYIYLFGSPLCSLHIEGPQSVDGSWDAQAQELIVDDDEVQVEQGDPSSTLCGPPSGDGTFQATYVVTSDNNIEIIES